MRLTCQWIALCSCLAACGGANGGRDGTRVGEPANLLVDPGFDQGPAEAWQTIRLFDSRATFSLEEGRAVITGGEAGVAMWRQVVPVEAGTVYLLEGLVGFEDIPEAGRCNLQAVFRDAADQVIEMIDFPSHTGTRELALDFPTGLKVRAPEGAVAAEVNLLLEGGGIARFDDVLFAPAPVGDVTGRVTGGGEPLAGARVEVHGDPWGRSYRAVTGADGSYRVEDLPVAFPRYILIASCDGYRTRSQGRVAVRPDEPATVDFELSPGDDPADDLRVVAATLELPRAARPTGLPADAAIPADAEGYPEPVRVYLQPSEAITSDHPDVIARAEAILAEVDNPTSTQEVAWEVYAWVSRNIDHDGVYSGRGGLDQPWRDVTSGIWQTISGEGWCWGRSFDDWTYKPHELLAVRGGICVEHAQLVTALLRALNVPARPFSGSCEFWAQTPDGEGAWYGMSTTDGRTSYRETGELGPGFATGRLTSYPVGAGSMMHEDWDADNPGLWRERHPWSESYPGTPEGLQQALADLETFARTGEAPAGTGARPDQDRYVIHYRDITLDLGDMGTQRELDTRFPLVPGNELHDPQDAEACWTNHPECVTGTRVETIENPPAAGAERWFHVTFDLTSLLD